MREWFRERVSLDADLAQIPLAVTNENTDYGVDQVYMDHNVQTGEARIVGVGSGTKRRRRVARVFVAIYGPKGEGEGVVSELTSKVEGIYRDAMDSTSDTKPDPLIRIFEPYSFERPEPGRYCQVVSVPLEQDYFQ